MTLPPFCRVHVLEAGLGGEEGAVEMDREHLLPVGEREVLERMHDLDAGIADRMSILPKACDRRLDAGVDLRPRR